MSSRFCAVSSTPAEQVTGSDVILPCQYYDISGGYNLSGEQRLMLALLTDAINVYQKGALSRIARARRLYVDAERWIMAERTGSDALSYNTVCEALGINSTLLRRRIIAWKHTVRRQRGDDRSSRLHLKVTPRERYASHRPSPSKAASPGA
ncbi:MAG TPA: hypothetical protein VJN94_16270 [Candidatus Binataceae bacterium]|nr:hypothetical protein [Candidatus Binataceae bacterium]